MNTNIIFLFIKHFIKHKYFQFKTVKNNILKGEINSF